MFFVSVMNIKAVPCFVHCAHSLQIIKRYSMNILVTIWFQVGLEFSLLLFSVCLLINVFSYDLLVDYLEVLIYFLLFHLLNKYFEPLLFLLDITVDILLFSFFDFSRNSEPSKNIILDKKDDDKEHF